MKKGKVSLMVEFYLIAIGEVMELEKSVMDAKISRCKFDERVVTSFQPQIT